MMKLRCSKRNRTRTKCACAITAANVVVDTDQSESVVGKWSDRYLIDGPLDQLRMHGKTPNRAAAGHSSEVDRKDGGGHDEQMKGAPDHADAVAASEVH